MSRLKEGPKQNYSYRLSGTVALCALLYTNQVYSVESKSTDINQTTAQKTASDLNNNGSDDSLEASTTNAMTAIMNLSALNIPGAFSYGYKAYGQYTNARTLDRLQAQTNGLKNSMSSNGASNTASSISGTPSASRTYGRLDPSYLYKGEAAVVAAEWEKRTGMRREEFLSQVVSASEAGLFFNDPNLLQKIEQRYQAFKAKITNKDFVAGLEKVEALYPSAARSKLLGQAMEKYAEWKNGFNESKVAEVAPILPDAKIEEKGTTSPPANANNETKTAERTLASEKAVAAPKEKLGSFIGVDSEKNQAFEDLLQSAANSDLDTESIFQRVSKKYRVIFAGSAKNAR